MEQALSQYKTFYETAKAGNISRAAEKLKVSQPAVSKSLSRLEAEFGTKLLIRNSRGVKLTAEGTSLYSHLDDAFSHIESAERELRNNRDFNIGYLRMGASTTLTKFILIPYLKEFIASNPYTMVHIENQATADTIRKLEAGKIDIGAVVLSKDRKDVQFLKLMNVEDIFVCTPEYLNNLKRLSGEDVDLFREATFMLLDRDNDTRKHIDEYFRKAGLEPLKVLEISTMDLLVDFAKIGMGISAVIKEFVSKELREGTLIELPMKIPISKRKAGFVYLESDKNDTLKQFIDSIK